MPRISALLPVAGLAAAATLVPCATADAATPANLVPIHTTRSNTVVAPATAHPGTADIRNSGGQAVFLARPLHGGSPADFAKAINGDGPSAFIKNYLAVDAVPAHSDTYVTLKAGTYYLADTSADSVSAKNVKTLKVTGRTVSVKVPAAKAVPVSAKNTVSAPATLPTKATLGLANGSRNLQLLFEAPVAAKVTATQLKNFLAKPSLQKLGQIAGGTPQIIGMLSPAQRATSSLTLSKARHLVFTFAYTSKTTEPSLSKGQVVAVTVK